MSKLVIQFRCLCFFVRDLEKGRMHVLTPATCGCEHGGVDRHAAFLVFPKEGGRLNAAGNFKQDGEDGKADYVEMDGWALTLGKARGRAVLGLKKAALDLNAVAQAAISPGLVRGRRDKRITSRVTLRGGSMTSTLAPGFWNFNRKKQIPMARDVVWTIHNLPDAPLEVRRSRFAVGQRPNPKGDEEVVTLLPNVRGEFRLEFHNSMLGDFGKPLETRDPDRAARHFKAYYTLYDRPRRRPIPKFVTSPDVGVVGCLGAVGTVPPSE